MGQTKSGSFGSLRRLGPFASVRIEIRVVGPGPLAFHRQLFVICWAFWNIWQWGGEWACVGSPKHSSKSMTIRPNKRKYNSATCMSNSRLILADYIITILIPITNFGYQEMTVSVTHHMTMGWQMPTWERYPWWRGVSLYVGTGIVWEDGTMISLGILKDCSGTVHRNKKTPLFKMTWDIGIHKK